MWAILPVKRPEHSKTRLSTVLSAEECGELATAMMLDVISALRGADRIEQIVMLTSDEHAAALGRGKQCQIIHDYDDQGLTSNLNQAAAEIEQQGADTLFIVHADLPMLSPADIGDAIARHQNDITICRASHDGGTNALFCTPPTAMPFQFGSASAEKHQRAAEALNLSNQTVDLPAFRRDIDRAEDLRWFTEQPETEGSGTHTRYFLQHSGIAERLKQAEQQPAKAIA